MDGVQLGLVYLNGWDAEISATDVSNLSKYGLNVGFKETWLASRSIGEGPSGAGAYIQCYSGESAFNLQNRYCPFSMNTYGGEAAYATHTCEVRAIFKLSDSCVIVSGLGSASSPYNLGL